MMGAIKLSRDSRFGQTSIGVYDARQLINSGMRQMSSERINVASAIDRVASATVPALISSPRFDVSAMDGYAVRSGDFSGPTTMLRIVASSKAGGGVPAAIEPYSCTRIFTGAPIPPGADSIVIQEDAEVFGDHVRFLSSPQPNQHVRTMGLNFRRGQAIVQVGRTITARDIGLLTAAGHEFIDVRQRPKVGVLSTGDELSEPSEGEQAGKIFDGNRRALLAAVERWGGEPHDLGIVGDDDAAIAAVLSALDVDLVVITGGASVGDHDRVRPVLEMLGASFDFWKIRMRPGKPLMFGMLNEIPVLGLPGNSVSALVCALLFLQPSIEVMTGGSGSGPVLENATLSEALGKTGDRDDYLRSAVRHIDGALFVEAFDLQDSSMLSILAKSNALLFRPALAPAAEPGEIVKVIRFDGVPGF